MFKRKLTNWIVLGNYIFADVDYIVFVRRNRKNGMLYFKTKKVQGNHSSHPILGHKFIDVQIQWEILQKLL